MNSTWQHGKSHLGYYVSQSRKAGSGGSAGSADLIHEVNEKFMKKQYSDKLFSSKCFLVVFLRTGGTLQQNVFHY